MKTRSLDPKAQAFFDRLLWGEFCKEWIYIGIAAAIEQRPAQRRAFWRVMVQSDIAKKQTVKVLIRMGEALEAAKKPKNPH